MVACPTSPQNVEALLGGALNIVGAQFQQCLADREEALCGKDALESILQLRET